MTDAIKESLTQKVNDTEILALLNDGSVKPDELTQEIRESVEIALKAVINDTRILYIYDEATAKEPGCFTDAVQDTIAQTLRDVSADKEGVLSSLCGASTENHAVVTEAIKSALN